MGTRSLTFVYNDNNQPIINMYRQFDGYPSGHGDELFNFLATKTIVNGFGEDTTGLANGMGCLAAQLVDEFKKDVGGIYLESVDNRDCWQDYTYEIRPDGETFKIKVISYDGDIEFDGPLSEFKAFCDND